MFFGLLGIVKEENKNRLFPIVHNLTNEQAKLAQTQMRQEGYRVQTFTHALLHEGSSEDCSGCYAIIDDIVAQYQERADANTGGKATETTD